MLVQKISKLMYEEKYELDLGVKKEIGFSKLSYLMPKRQI